MRVLFTAAGSIGSRHIQNLQKKCREETIPLTIDVYRHSSRHLPFEIKEIINREIVSDEELEDWYDVVFITDQTSTHIENIKKYIGRSVNMFIEKPISHTPEIEINQIIPEDKAGVFYVAAPIRFSKYYRQIKKIVAENKVYSARIVFSDYMPEWQKNRDYRSSFRCFTEQGGGVDIDSIHEIDFMVDLFGNPLKKNVVTGKYSDLEMNACDLATFIYEYSDKIVEVHLDYFGKKRQRTTTLYTDQDVICVDFDTSMVKNMVTKDETYFGPDDHFYQDEMSYFVDLIIGKVQNNINSPKHAMDTLRLIRG